MRDWVIPTLRAIRPEGVSEEAYEAELAEPTFAWRRLGNLFLHQFDSDGMTELLGSVLGDIPRSDFDKLFEIHPFFILARSAGFCQKFHATGDVQIIVFTETDLLPMTWEQRRGCVGHELAHVILGHLDRPFSLDDPWRKKQEKEADDLCREWGLSEEINGVRRHLFERRIKDGNR